MMTKRFLFSSLIACAAAAGCLVAVGLAQESKPSSSGNSRTVSPGRDEGSLPIAVAGDQVVIKRDAVTPLDPLKYRTALYLSPAHSVTLVAPFDATVRGLPVKVGQSLQAQAEVLRLDNAVQKFQAQRVQSLYKVALLEQKLTADSAGEDQKELAQAKVDAVKADLDLAQHQLDQASVRIPFAGEVLRFLVSEGQFVKAGDPLALAGDTTSLQVEVPAERSQVDKAKSLAIKVEGQSVDAQIQSVLPLDPKFDSLRELFDSITSAVLTVDNAKRVFRPGQTVFVPLIPRHPVAEVPASAIGNQKDGGRKVQVLRDYTVRDISVVLMGSVGEDRLFVSGPFAQGDEVIYESSHQLADGFPVKSSGGKTKKAEGGSASENKPAKPAVDF